MLRNIGIVGLLCVWLVASIWKQIVLVIEIARRVPLTGGLKVDPFGLVPCWLLWSNPGTEEYFVLYRDRLISGSLTPWRNSWSMPRNPFRWICNPHLRKWKTCFDAWFLLLGSVAIGKKQPAEMFMSRTYLSTAVYISNLQPSLGVEFRQFMVARTSIVDQEKPAEILFVSPFFRAGEADYGLTRAAA